MSSDHGSPGHGKRPLQENNELQTNEQQTNEQQRNSKQARFCNLANNFATGLCDLAGDFVGDLGSGIRSSVSSVVPSLNMPHVVSAFFQKPPTLPDKYKNVELLEPPVQDAASQKDVAAELAETKTQVEDGKTLLEDAKTRLDAANALLAMDLSTIAKLKDESSKLRLLVGSLGQERANLVQRNEEMRQQLLRTQTDLVINHNIIHYLKQQPVVAAQLRGEWYERFDTPIQPLDTSSTGSAVPGDPGPAGGHH